jgi:hypothetical protein
MRKLLKLVCFILFGALVLAQEKVPTIKVESKAAILEIQLRIANESAAYQQIQKQMDDLRTRYQADSAALAKAIAEAEKDTPGYTLDPQTLQYVKKPAK